MGCGSSVRAENAVAPTIPMMNSAEELEDEAERCLEEAESGMDEAAEFLTLGASEGSILDHYIIGARLGGGSFAQVHRAKHLATKAQVAIKILNLGTDAKKSLRLKAPLSLSKPGATPSARQLGSLRFDIAGYSQREGGLRRSVSNFLSASPSVMSDPRNSSSVVPSPSGHEGLGGINSPSSLSPSQGGQHPANNRTPRNSTRAGATGGTQASPSGRKYPSGKRSVSIDQREASIAHHTARSSRVWADESIDIRGSAASVGPTKTAQAPASDELKMLCREIGILRTIDHPSIVKFHQYFLSPKRNRIFIVMQLLEGGDLVEALSKRRGNTYTEADAAKVFGPVLRGLEYLHGRGIVHRDMKLDNLLLEDGNDLGSTKIADFGMAKKLMMNRHKEYDEMLNRTLCGTPAYIAPELLLSEGDPGTSSCDMWSAGVILHVLLTGCALPSPCRAQAHAPPRPALLRAYGGSTKGPEASPSIPSIRRTMPFIDDNVERLYEKIRKADLDMSSKVWEGVSDLAQTLVCGLLNKDPAVRFTATDALNHEWIRGAGSWLLCAPETPAKQRLREHILASTLKTQALRDKDYLMRQGEPSAFIFFVQKGIVEVFCEANLLGDGTAASVVPLGRCAAGEYIGEFTLIDAKLIEERIARPGEKKGEQLRFSAEDAENPPCPISVRANGDVEVLLIRMDDLRRHMDSNPAAAVAVLDEAQKRLEWLEGRLDKARAWRNGVFVQDANGRYRRALMTATKAKRGTVTCAEDWEHSLPESPLEEQRGRERLRSMDGRPQSAGLVQQQQHAPPPSIVPFKSSLAGPPPVIYEGRESVVILSQASRTGDSPSLLNGGVPSPGSDGASVGVVSSPGSPTDSRRGSAGRTSTGGTDLKLEPPAVLVAGEAPSVQQSTGSRVVPKVPPRRFSSLIGADE